MQNKRILYLTYDGLTDPLGRSQILPYLLGLEKNVNKIHIISCEKKNKYYKNKHTINDLISNSNIIWHPVFYHKRPPIISTLLDIINIKIKAFKITKQYNINIVHCRSYIASIIGLKLKRKYQVKFVFDMRGFFPDERVDGNVWSLKNPIYKLVYKYFKRKEKDFFNESDKIISLTYSGKKEILKMNLETISDNKIEIIPCCSDFNLFVIPDYQTKQKCRSELKIDEEKLVFCYLGSLGTWYLINEMFEFFKQIKNHFKNAFFLLISNDSILPYSENIRQLGISSDDILTINSSREKLPYYLSCVDIGISFIKPCFSKKASSPTKVAEMLAMGIPMIVNKNVGDMDEIFNNKLFGKAIDVKNINNIDNFEKLVMDLKESNPVEIHNEAKKMFDLKNVGVKKYEKIYKEI